MLFVGLLHLAREDSSESLGDLIMDMTTSKLDWSCDSGCVDSIGLVGNV